MWVVVKEKEMGKRKEKRKQFCLHVGVLTVDGQEWPCLEDRPRVRERDTV